MPKTNLPASIARTDEEVVVSAGIPIEAYYFLQAGLQRAATKVHGELVGGVDRPDQTRHISGQQLCEGLREIAIERWGLMAPAVLGAWGIHRTRDFGDIVFALIEAQRFQKQPHDRVEDFENVYDFRRAFVTDYRVVLPRVIA
jgi:uncharacterized repeat protein (TIGR04138 family)